MKLITAIMAILLLISVTVVSAAEINASAELKGDNTVISCAPVEGGTIDRAYVSILSAASGSGERQAMEVSVDNRATYVLAGVHEKIEVRCKFFMASNSGVGDMPSTEKSSRTTLQEEFSLAAK